MSSRLPVELSRFEPTRGIGWNELRTRSKSQVDADADGLKTHSRRCPSGGPLREAVRKVLLDEVKHPFEFGSETLSRESVLMSSDVLSQEPFNIVAKLIEFVGVGKEPENEFLGLMPSAQAFT